VAGTFNIVRVAVALPYVGFWQILLQKSAIAMVRLRHRFSGTVFLSRRV
jgi:hypothetical protein